MVQTLYIREERLRINIENDCEQQKHHPFVCECIIRTKLRKKTAPKNIKLDIYICYIYEE